MEVGGNVKSVTWNSNPSHEASGSVVMKVPKVLQDQRSHHEAKQGTNRNLIRGKDSPALIKHKFFSTKISQTLLTPITHLQSVFVSLSPPLGLRGLLHAGLTVGSHTRHSPAHSYCQNQLLSCKITGFNRTAQK